MIIKCEINYWAIIAIISVKNPKIVENLNQCLTPYSYNVYRQACLNM